MGSKHLDGGWVEGDAAGLVGLGVLDSDELVGVGDGPGNRQRGKVEVEVLQRNPHSSPRRAPVVVATFGVPAFLPVAAPVDFGDQFGSGSLGVPLGALDVPPDVALAAGLGVTSE